jgi:hypothetical protein
MTFRAPSTNQAARNYMFIASSNEPISRPSSAPEASTAHKKKRFRSGDNPVLTENQAFVLSDPATRRSYHQAYAKTSALYYGAKPTFEQILAEIKIWIDRL